MSPVACLRCGLVAAFGTPEQRINEIRRHACPVLMRETAFRNHPSNSSWMPGGAA